MIDSFEAKAPCGRCRNFVRSVVGEGFCTERQVVREGARPGAVRLSLHAARVICCDIKDGEFKLFEPVEAESDDERF